MKLLLRCVLFLELLDTTFLIHDLLFAGIKTDGTWSRYRHGSSRGRRVTNVFAACACDLYLFIVRITFSSHGDLLQMSLLVIIQKKELPWQVVECIPPETTPPRVQRSFSAAGIFAGCVVIGIFFMNQLVMNDKPVQTAHVV